MADFTPAYTAYEPAYSVPYEEMRITGNGQFTYRNQIVDGKPVLLCTYILKDPIKLDNGSKTRELKLRSSLPMFHGQPGFPTKCQTLYFKDSVSVKQSVPKK